MLAIIIFILDLLTFVNTRGYIFIGPPKETNRMPYSLVYSINEYMLST